MIIADTSVWIDHLRAGDGSMNRLLQSGQVAMHPFVLGEVSLGHLDPRAGILGMLQSLPASEMAENGEVLEFIDRYRLFGTGLGFVDVHLLTATALTFCALWTRDKRLRATAERLGIAAKGLN
jgi:predicted nucleic acid-binding protein